MAYESRERPRCQRCGGSLAHEDERCCCGGRSQCWPEPQLRRDRAPESAYGVADRPLYESRAEIPAESRGLTWEQCFDELMSRYVSPE